jgi:hypothetical protein
VGSVVLAIVAILVVPRFISLRGGSPG